MQFKGSHSSGVPSGSTHGRHILVECYDSTYASLDDLDLIRNAMLQAAREMEMTILGDHFHKFAPQGVSGAVVVAESHLTIHTWPEDGYAAIDFFTCGTADPHEGFMVLARALGSGTMKVVEMARGRLHAAGGGESARTVAEMSYVFGAAPVEAQDELDEPEQIPEPVSLVG